MLVFAPAAMAQDTLNCEDFNSQAEAQANLRANPSDPNNLDAENDGVACETFAYPEGTPRDETPVSPAQSPSGDLDCEDFATQEEAQAVFNQDTSDPDGLDADNDGFACEEPSSETPTATPTTQDTTVSCSDFVSAAGNPSQFQAQQFYDFEATPAQQAALDADGDGFACDDLETGVDNLGETDADRTAANNEYSAPTATEEAPAPTVAEETPAPTAAAETPAAIAVLPATGGSGLLIPAAGILLLGSGLIGMRILRR